MLDTAQYPRAARAKGLYESFYLKAGHPTQPAAVWIRYTVHKRPGAAPSAATWLTYFDARLPAPFAAKTTVPSPRPSSSDYLHIGDSSFGPRRARGGAGEATWDLELGPSSEPLEHLPRRWMYRAPLPRTKLVSLAPETTISGTLQLPGNSVTVDGWPGMIGHNWGAEHAERWIWLHAIFGPQTWFDVALGRIRIGGRTTPWVANGMISLEGRRHRVGGVGKTRATRVEESVTRCSFELPGEMPVRGWVERPVGQTVAWPYADPSGPQHHSLNCSIAAMELTGGGRSLATEHGAVYELGVRETDHGIAVLPFEDG